METRSDFEGDVDFNPFNAPGEAAPAGLQFSEEAGTHLANQMPAEGFDPKYEQDVEGLLWLGLLTETVSLYGHHFVIKTLTRGEKLACALLVGEWEESMGLAMAFQTITLAASILTVDEMPLNPNLSPDTNPRTRIESNFTVVGQWYDPLIEALYERYSLLNMRAATAFGELQSK